ncbi:MAG: hypothetical protein HKM87_08325 [Ignavibacteriaceae bacterium]|nr:hypothetical protein [Ignavibacteriaceae bacterium]
MSSEQFQITFKVLKTALKKHEKNLTIKTNTNDVYNLYAGYSEKYKRDIYFGGVEIKKNYVSFHLMPVYINPNLLNDMSPELKKRMQGKSCFNFKTIDKNSLKELTALTKKGFDYYKYEGML